MNKILHLPGDFIGDVRLSTISFLIHAFEFDNSAIRILIRWWNHSFTDMRPIFDKEHRDLYTALNQAGLEIPFITFDLNLQMRSRKSVSHTLEICQDPD